VTSRILKLSVVLAGGILIGGLSFSWWASADSEVPTTLSASAETSTTATIPPTTTTTTLPPTTTTTKPVTTTTTEPPKGTLVIHGTGDVAVDPEYIPALAANGWDHAWSGLDGLFLADDLTVINLECVPSDIGEPLPKSFAFRCPTDALPSIRGNGIEVANLGNNHSGDYGKEALVDGRHQLIDAGIAPVGAGKDVHEAGLPALFEVNGWRVAVVGFGGVAPSTDWYATEDRSGMRSGDHDDEMVEAVSAAAEVADLVIVTIHWGRELATQPLTEDIVRAEAMIEAGADIIFGHHQHRLNPLETVNGAPVFWGLGNFVWPHNSNASATTAVARVVVHPDGTMDSCMIPAFIETHGRPVLTAEPECGPGS
jgi:poly-gamma-glutamate capsule biosynthesis protein CapA/YwtB (metallophosphatase superfamily)